MPLEHNLELFFYASAALTVVLTSIRFLFGWFMNYDNATRFTRDMALNHLPYIYRSLRLISEHLGVSVEEEPHINFSRKDARG